MKNPLQAVSDAMLTKEITRPVEDPFRFLKEHHRKIDDFFSQMEDADREEEDKKDMLFMRINEGLTLHADIEETLIYPKLQSLEETRELTSMAYQEHDIVKNLLTELEMIPYDSEEWTPKANVLMENVRHHVEEEEDDLLPKAESSLGEEEQRMLGREVETYLTTREENSLPSA